MIPLRRAVPVWVRIALQSFGGPAGQIAVMHRILVDEERWISERRFLHALRFCTLLPGPEATQLATYVGWLMHGTAGGLLAGILFVLPGFLAILALSIIYLTAGHLAPVTGLFFGLKAAILAIVVDAVLRIGRRSLRHPVLVAMAAAAFLAIFVLQVPFPWIVLAAALLGTIGFRRLPQAFAPAVEPGEDAASTGPPPLLPDSEAPPARPPLASTARVAARWLALWILPVAALAAGLGRGHVLVRLGVFFSEAAVVTFGGAYAVLAYVAQRAVGDFGWLTPREMVDGLALAETTPGPLIMVLQFVGFLAAARGMPGAGAITAGVLGSLVTVWVTFVPCFLFVLAGAPLVEWLRGRRSLEAALTGITAAVVGVILNLAVWFSLHVLFHEVTVRRLGPVHLELPRLASLDTAALTLAVLAAVATFRFRVGMLPVLGGAAALGLAWRLLGR
jgi:chromate transporter